MPNLPPQYDPQQHEPAMYTRWEEAGAFAPSAAAIAAGKKPFVMMLPPPNITGRLHMGHALQDTIMDILARFHRQLGDPVLWLPGIDHAALPTNKIINDQLAAEGTTRHAIGREVFQQKAEAWYAKTSSEIIDQMKRLGCSCDWSRQRFTMDEAYSRAVQETFVRYYEKGHIYRGARMVNWDPKAQTTVSDLEIDWQTERTPLYTFQYGPFHITTARPETKFGDKYVVMHPDDERYAQYQPGDTFVAEWINGPVTATVVKDTAIDPTFGSGVMTITPWHDATDFAIAQRHQLDMEQIIDFQGKLLPIAGEFAGRTVAEARPLVVAKLQEKGLVVDIQENYQHNVARNDRGKGMIEPQVMRQWFVDMSKLKDETIAVVDDELIRFVPPRWKEHFLEWMHGIHDWNINRQIWLGHRLPVWWKTGVRGTDQENEPGAFVVSLERPTDGEWEQDPDVLDTWFSSALWPFATLGWPTATPDLAAFYPSSVLVTARDILYLWVARMIFSGLELLQGTGYGEREQAQRIPFHDVFIHPTVLAKNGQRMSKSLGTGVDPQELINQYGADATRFGLMYQMSYDNQAIKFDEQSIVAARNFANKIWNLGRFILSLEEKATPTIADDWIMARCNTVSVSVTQLIAEYKLGEAARLLHEFVWDDFADWYIEILKIQGSPDTARAVFQTILTLLHPFMPHLTEVLWHEFNGQGLLITSPWPTATTPSADGSADIARLQDIVRTIRSARVLLGIPPTGELTVAVPQPPLPEIIAPLAKVTLGAVTPDMKTFPLVTGGSLAIGGAHITPQALNRAMDKLRHEQTQAQELLEHVTATLQKMAGRALPERIAVMEEEQQKTQARLREIQKSLELLQ